MPLFDPARPVTANRAVSARELARDTRALLDAIERDGAIIALSRYGRMVALLTPLPERMSVEFECPSVQPWVGELREGIEIMPEWLEFGPVAEEMLLGAADNHPMPFALGSLSYPGGEILGAIARLEMAGLVERGRAGNMLTPEGLATAAVLRRRLDTNGSAHPS